MEKSEDMQVWLTDVNNMPIPKDKDRRQALPFSIYDNRQLPSIHPSKVVAILQVAIRNVENP